MINNETSVMPFAQNVRKVILLTDSDFSGRDAMSHHAEGWAAEETFSCSILTSLSIQTKEATS